MDITIKQWSTLRYKIQRFYGLKREVTDAEIQAELDMLQRHYADGTLDDNNMLLYSVLTTGKNAILI